MDGRCGKDAERWKDPLRVEVYRAGQFFLHAELTGGAVPHTLGFEIFPDGRTIKPGYWIMPVDVAGDDPAEDAARYGKAARVEAEKFLAQRLRNPS